ncbi:hypothetical protein B7463_g7006, partial [Scytalidium lignicola]
MREEDKMLEDLTQTVQSLQKRLQDFEDERALNQLLNTYCSTADHHDWKAFAECFTEDGVMEFEGWGPVQGKEKIARVAGDAETRFQGLQHTMTNHSFDLKSAEEATGTCYLWFCATPDTNKPDINYSFGGWYRWEFVRTRQGWKIEKMHLRRMWSMGTDTEKQWT